jgi:hypothetical protein
MKLLTATVVVLSDGNNPRILSPDFLGRNGIVPGNWGVQDTLVVPVISRVVYSNGVEITIEENRVSLRSTRPAEFDWRDELGRMAVSFMATLHHVAYRAVGLNFELVSGYDADGDLRTTLFDMMLLRGTWAEFGRSTRCESIKLLLDVEDAVLNLTVHVGVVPDEHKIGQDVFRFDANFHCDFNPEQSVDRRRYIESIGGRYDRLMELLKIMPMVTK